MSTMKPYGFHSTPVVDNTGSAKNPINICVAPDEPEEVEPETPRVLGRSVARTLIDMFDNSDEPVIVQTAAGKAPYSQAFGSLDSSDVEECSVGDEEILENAKGYSADFLKRMRCEEAYDDDQDPAEPDLQEYFSGFDLDETQIIAICRTYANYLAQRVRSRWGNVKKLKVKK